MSSTRNKPCHCGSGKKYKKCHLLIEREVEAQALKAWKTPQKLEEPEAPQKSPAAARPYESPYGGRRVRMATMLAAAAMLGSTGRRGL